MSRITGIVPARDGGRFFIHIDGEYCTSVRERTFPAMGLFVGREISCEELKELESHHWKHSYGPRGWKEGTIRVKRVLELIEGIDERVKVNVTGFGADTDTFIEGHAEEAGSPDLALIRRGGHELVLQAEVTGTKRMRGSSYWVRPDKLAYARAHPDEDVWIILHFAEPVEKFVFIKPDGCTEYTVSEKVIRGSRERFVEFHDSLPEVKTFGEFCRYLKGRLDSIK